MSFFNLAEPIFRTKQEALDIQDLQGLIRFHWRLGRITLVSLAYTRVDQVFVLWAGLVALMFATAQFAPILWTTQAMLWSGFTLVGTVLMGTLSWYWVTVERLRWLVWAWAILLLGGLGLTDYGIFSHYGFLMGHLCHIWLVLSAIGYGITGLGLRSRALFVISFAHGLGLLLLPLVQGWSFGWTGSIMAISLVVLGECQWDMRPPSAYNRLSAEQRQFNQQQHRLRQLIA